MKTDWKFVVIEADNYRVKLVYHHCVSTIFHHQVGGAEGTVL